MRLDLSAHLARRFGARVAMTDANRNLPWTFEDVDHRANLVAGRLRVLKVGAGDRISVLSAPDPAVVALFFGALKVGATLIPHNLRLSAQEISEELARIRPSLLVLGRAGVPDLDGTASPSLPTTSLSDLMDEGAAASSPSPEPLDWEAPALVLSTGGSTGRPKGAILSLRAVLMNALTTVDGWRLTGDDSTLGVYPMFHTGGWNVLLLPLLVVGGRSVFLDRFAPVDALRIVDAERVTILSGVPSMFIEMVGRPEFARASLASLRFVKSGGGNSPPAVEKAFRSRGIPFYQGYGLTEAGPNLLYSTEEDLARPGTIGRPNLLADLRLRDEHGREGDVGELLVGGPLLFSGYLDDPAASAATMEGRYVRTGDVMRCDADGFYYFIGRTKLMFKSGGENVYFTEVEQVLESHPAVVEAAVIGVPDPKWGEVGLAHLVLREHVSDDELRRYLRKRLAAFKVPKSFVRRNELPHTRAGKKDYPLLLRERGG